jgi:nicotinamidase-related amidase
MGLPLQRVRSSWLSLPLAAFLWLCLSAGAGAQSLPPLAKSLTPQETALILIDYQYPFTDPNGANRRAVGKEMDDKKMLDRTVDLVKKARSLGVLVVHVTEGYSKDYRELDPTNPGGFHRGQILRHAWVIGTKEQSYYEPLLPGPGDKDVMLAPRIQTSAFGGTGLNEILLAHGIRNIGVAGFTSDVCVYATVTNGYDLGYHVYALKDLAVGYFPEQAELMVKNTYPMWSKVLDSDEWVAMLGGGHLASNEAEQSAAR